MPVGTVKWFDCKKGFGFIVNNAGQDVFVHFTSITGEGFRALRDGEQVEYEQIESDKGLSARAVKRLVPVGGKKAAGNGAAATPAPPTPAAAEPSPADIPTVAHLSRPAASPKAPKL